MTSPLELAFNHLQAALRNGLILFPMMFGLGAIAAWGLISRWQQSPAAALLIAGVSVASGTWLTWTWFRSRGLMHAPDDASP